MDAVRTCNGNAAESVLLLIIQHIFDNVFRREDDRIGNETVLMAFDGTDHGGLRSSRLVVVNYTNAPE